MKTFSFDDIGIAKIFSDFSLSIPPHQRDYAWTDEEVEQLFSDVEAAYRAVITHPLLRGLLISESMREWIKIPLNG